MPSGEILISLKRGFSGPADFSEAQFSGDADFRGAQFSAFTDFNKVLFSGNTGLYRAQFSWNANFGDVEFSQFADFGEVKFLNSVSFRATRFLGFADFRKTRFSKNIEFEENYLKGDLIFSEILLGEETRFHLRGPKFQFDDASEPERPVSIIFDRVAFRAFYTFFELIRCNRPNGEPKAPVLIFRYCELKDVYFTNNDMSLFSFYKSSFDEARFISSRWSDTKDKILGLIPYRRKNVIAEERFLSGSLDKDEFRVDDLIGYEDIASLYRRMKTALDNTKDYQQASWFYFNEFEMKRLALKHEIEISRPGWKIFRWQPCIWAYKQFKKIFSRYRLYCFYKVFAGYGEKPWWSFIWFWILTVFFAFGHMVFGLEYFPGGVRETKYEFFSFLDNFSFGSFMGKFWSSFGYSVSRAIPKTYIPYVLSNTDPTNPLGTAWSILNTVVLWTLIIFIAIGLKRHFRRF